MATIVVKNSFSCTRHFIADLLSSFKHDIISILPFNNDWRVTFKQNNSLLIYLRQYHTFTVYFGSQFWIIEILLTIKDFSDLIMPERIRRYDHEPVLVSRDTSNDPISVWPSYRTIEEISVDNANILFRNCSL